MWWLWGQDKSIDIATGEPIDLSLFPEEVPKDAFAALGSNGQNIYVIPSKKLVVIRMGSFKENTSTYSFLFNINLWKKINKIVK